MLTFADGPAKGQILMCARAPVFLRVTEKEGGGKDRWDALDMVDDQPQPGERVYVYLRQSSPGFVRYCGRSKGRSFGRTEQTAEYRLFDPQPADSVVRDAEKWQAWARERYAERLPSPGLRPASESGQEVPRSE